MDSAVFITVGVGIVVNIIIVAYGYGKLTQRVDYNNHNSVSGSKNRGNNQGTLYPECLRMFQEIRTNLDAVKGDVGVVKGNVGELKGKVDMLIELARKDK